MGLFGPDKITLTLDSTHYRPGDTIKGMISLNLRKTTHARKMEVGLIGEMTETQRTQHVEYRRDSRGRAHPSSHQHTDTKIITVYDFTMQLDGEKDYQNEQYSFEIKIPLDILQTQSQQQYLPYGVTRSPVRWKVHAKLDIPLKLDVQKKQDIVISY
ncbi:MAG: hypothetical protein QXS02_00635 [Candidatus Thermoplasmatota archaeon]